MLSVMQEHRRKPTCLCHKVGTGGVDPLNKSCLTDSCVSATCAARFSAGPGLPAPAKVVNMVETSRAPDGTNRRNSLSARPAANLPGLRNVASVSADKDQEPALVTR